MLLISNSMSMYQSIKKFGRKALLVGGAIAVLSGCSENVQYKATQIFSDVNRDGRKDLVYLREFYPRSFVGGAVPDYELRVANGNGDGTFGESRVIKSYGSEKPAGLH